MELIKVLVVPQIPQSLSPFVLLSDISSGLHHMWLFSNYISVNAWDCTFKSD